jgi:hypothetical protein
MIRGVVTMCSRRYALGRHRRHAIRRRRGSMALFLCLTLSAAILYGDVLLRAARLRAAETSLLRALDAQVQVNLANYDTPLRAFGLFGFRASTIEPAVFQAALPSHFAHADCTITPARPIDDPAILQPQVIRYMNARVPMVAVDLLLHRLAGFGQFLNQDLRPAAAPANPAAPTKDMPQSGLASLIHNLSGGLASQGIRMGAQSLFGDVLDKLEDQMILELEATYRLYAAEWLGAGPDDGLREAFGQTPDLLAPASLENLANRLEHLLDFKTAPAYEKICLVEYILGQFRPSVVTLADDEGETPLCTLDGRRFCDFPDERQAEVEMILTGMTDPGPARRCVQLMIISLRGLVHLAAILSDEQEMIRLKAGAAATAAAVATLSSGAVCVDPQVVLYLIVAGQAIRKAMQDYSQLADGKSLGILPGRAGDVVQLYYQDYLRLFLLAVPSGTLLDRTAARIGRLLPGRYTALTVAASWGGRHYCRTGGYRAPSEPDPAAQ